MPALRRTLGEANVKEVEPIMGAEDFGLFGQGGVPTFMFRLGSTPEELLKEAAAKGEAIPSLHSSLYQPDPAEHRDRRPGDDRGRASSCCRRRP